MAGAGYKLFNTGDVLTAAQVNTYLMEQTVMVFANAAARTTALSGVVSEGMISYLKDTNAVEVYDGSNWVSSDDPNAIQNTIVDAKGDLITATAADTPSRLAVGNSGDTLVADSSATTGLRWQSNFAAGKNKIINGDFNIWQRGTSFSAVDSYTADRWNVIWDGSGATRTITRETFTPGTAPVAGYEGQYFFRYNQSVAGSGGTYSVLRQRIEDVRTFAGQTVTISFWAKANTNTTLGAPAVQQNFGSGGSSSVTTVSNATASLTTSWARYSMQVSVPSVSGKTIGTSSYLEFQIFLPINTTFTLDFWGVQLEAGNVATAFQTATGTLAGELCAAQRYYQLIGSGSGKEICNLAAYTSTAAYGVYASKVTMRTAPTLSIVTGSSYYTVAGNNTADACDSISLDNASPDQVRLFVNSGIAVTQGYAYWLESNNASAFLALQSEL